MLAVLLLNDCVEYIQVEFEVVNREHGNGGEDEHGDEEAVGDGEHDNDDGEFDSNAVNEQ